MPEFVLSTAERRVLFPEEIDMAFESGGLGEHMHAVDNFKAGKVSEWIQESIGYYGRNYLIFPYIHGWIGRDDFDGPHTTAPLSDAHVRLLNETRKEYDRD